MSITLGKISGGAAYFKPKNHMTDIALIVEGKSLEQNVPSTYNNQTRYRDEILADITVFKNNEQLAAGTPDEILKDHKITHGMMVGNIKDSIGSPVAVVAKTTTTQNGSGYVFRAVEDEEYVSQVVAYLEKRESEKQAAIADAPDFD